MSDRLTSQWTPTLEQAFGASGAKGREGEMFVKEAVESWGWDVIDNEASYEEQVAGQDLWIKKPSWHNHYSIDVKANMNDFGAFYVDPVEWMKSEKKNHRYWHVNVDTGWMAWYAREEMQNYITTNNKTKGFWVGVKDKLPVNITRRHYGK